MKHASFVHLHTHSAYSILHSTCRIADMVKRAADYHMPALALTDNANLYGVVSFFETCRSHGIQPVIGAHMYMAPKLHTDKTPHGIPDESYNLVLLVRNETGYRNLMKLLTIAQFEGFYYKPRIDKETLAAHADGLLGLSGNLSGEIAGLILQDRMSEARDVIGFYASVLGRENFFLELTDHGLKRQKQVNRTLLELSKSMQIPAVAANDCYYLQREDSFAHQIARCIETGTTLNESRSRIEGTEHYFKSPQEMLAFFSECPEVVTRTLEVAERCHFDLDLSRRHMPDYRPPDGRTQEAYLQELCRKGMPGRVDPDSPDVRERLAHEMRVVKQMGFLSYFLIVWDFIDYAKKQNIPVGPGRGSAAGSLIAYLLGITDINPLKHQLLFERFLNPDRISLPDIDIDFCYDRREEVIDYVARTYGRRAVAQIITFGTLAARAVIRDVGRVMNMPYPKVDGIAKMIPGEPRMTLKKAMEIEPLLRELMAEDREVDALFNNALKLEGLPRNVSTHAAGIIIGAGDLTDVVALYRGQKGEVVTQLDGPDCERIGLLKMDFLGLRTLTVLHEALKLVQQNHEAPAITNLKAIPDADARTFELLNKANTLGVFQLESAGMRDLMRRLGVHEFSDVVALVALYRPGPMQMADDFIRRKHGEVRVEYLHPGLEPVLKETFGIMLYQEQVMQCAQVIAGFTLAEADNLRRIMGKKKEEAMLKLRDQFIAGAVARGVGRPAAEKIFEAMAYFAGYGFNKSHSVAYGWIAYQTAWFKANYPIEFMAALLTSERGNTDKISLYVEECRTMGIPVEPPSVQRSASVFSVEGRSIRFGLSAIKNVGESAVDLILEARERGGTFVSLEDFAKRVDQRAINKKTLESLILAGAFDGMHPNRRYLMAMVDDLIRYGGSSQRDQVSGQESFLDLLDAGPGQVASPKKEAEHPNYPEHELLRFEKDLMGCYLSGHPLALYARVLRRFSTQHTRNLVQGKDGDTARLGGVISSVKFTRTSKGDEKMAIFQLEDLKGTLEAVVFPRQLPEYEELLVPETPVFVEGTLRFRNENPGLIVNQMCPLDAVAEQLTESLLIRIFESDGKERLAALKTVLEQFPGGCPVLLDITLNSGDTVIVKPGSRYQVHPAEETIQAIEAQLGEGSVWLHIRDKQRQTFQSRKTS